MSAFTTVIQVRFGHVDPAGIAYFPRIYDYIHEVYEELWERHVGVRYDRLLMGDRIGFPLVHSEVDFGHPLRFGDRPVVRVTCTRLGKSSVELRYVFKLDDVVCVDARMTTVCTDLNAMKSFPLPAEYRARFEQILDPRHAGEPA
jgi:4-hydroxybenzoyl-CoA thioesterase